MSIRVRCVSSSSGRSKSERDPHPGGPYRQPEPHALGERYGPRCGGEDHGPRFQRASVGPDAQDSAPALQEHRHAPTFKTRPELLCRPEEADGGGGGVGVSAARLVGSEGDASRVDCGVYLAKLLRPDELGLYPHFPLQGDVAFEGLDVLFPDEVGEARAGEAAAAPDPLAPRLEIVGEALPGQVRFQGRRVVGADQRTRAGRRARGRTIAIEHQGVHTALGEVEGDARAHHSGPDNYRVGCVHSASADEGLDWP